MIDAPAERSSRPGIAAFDFDGTLVRRDTLLPFLAKLAGRRRTAAALAAQARRYRQDSDAAKLDVLQRLVAGRRCEHVEALGAQYAVGLHHLLSPDTIAEVRRHRREGHRLVMVSASLGVYLRPFGETLGFDEVIGVELVCDTEGTLTGEVEGHVNVRGPEKARRLQVWLAEQGFADPEEVEIWAYGDSSGDAELLAMADHARWMRRGRPINP